MTRHDNGTGAPRRGLRALHTALALAVVLGGCSSPGNDVAEPMQVPWRDQGHSVVLALDPTASATRTDDAVESADRAWVSILDQQFGPFDVVSTLEIESDAASQLADRRVLVLPRATIAAMTTAVLERIETHVAQGLTAIVEQPDTDQAAFLGLRVAASERIPRVVWPFPVPTLASGTEIPGNGLVPRPLAVPCDVVRYAPGADPRRRAEVAQSAAQRPAVWTLDVGAGRWVILAHGIAAWERRLRGAHSGESGAVDLPWAAAWTTFALRGDAATAPWPRWDTEANAPGTAPAASGSEARTRSPLRWAFDGTALSIELEVEEAAREGLALVLPRRWRHLRLVDWTVDWSPSATHSRDAFGLPELCITIPAGTKGTALAVYR